MTEIEVKIELTAEAIDALLLTDMFRQPSRTSNQHDIYFDTGDQSLRKAGYSLRVRKTESGFVQTIKSVQSGTSDIYARGEWERPLPDGRPIIDLSTPLAQTLQLNAGDLTKQFEVDVARQRWLITQEDSDIEIALDRGMISAGDRQTALSEMELELKDGKAEALFSLLQRLAGISRFRMGVVSKSERGYVLMDAMKHAFKAEPVTLDRTMTVPASLQLIAASCFRQFRLNEAALLQHSSPEALHSARVALRRLRSALRLYRTILPKGEISFLDDELQWLAAMLGKARDLDVLLARATETALQDSLSAARAKAYDAVMAALESERASALFVAFNQWLRCGAYLDTAFSAEEPQPALADFAADVLTSLRKKLRKHGGTLSRLDDKSRHRARKDAKRLRYAAEFFASLFPGGKSVRRHATFVQAMERLQDKMGLITDLAGTDFVLKELGLDGAAGTDTLVPDGAKEELIGDAQRALDKLLRLKKFWR